ncbi:Amuc_1100 family pilus-like protein [Opitutus terrae]|uniref:Uncharacterized protein n=1 Tax=Opitutus terrae (strain DSM 11246 / JCM 15787 / PB90-1) TaxID=452637 RepID=B1ZX79_OPITP|nr:Amuc_1100 family pilus-like protein [Opitutus terrae]ACB76131.1 hypothetical protein Oter_2850 [Opitutus terrae PB90-1]
MKQAFRSVYVWSIPAVVALAVGGLGERAWAAHRARVVLRETEQVWRTLAASRPEPTAAAAAELDADLADATNALLELRSATARNRSALTELDQAELPASAAEAFFDLARFGERMRGVARDHQVELAPEERFGFAAYAHAGPAEPAIAGVFRQRQLIERLLAIVFAAEPRELVLLERPRVAGEPTAEAHVGQRATDALFFRVGFTGETAALCSVLNALATSELPWIVRTIEVEPASAKQTASQSEANAPEVRVARGLSQFIIHVDCASLPPSADEPASTTASLPPADAVSRPPIGGAMTNTLWRAPASQRRGDDWIYDLFTPPQIRYEQRSGRLVVVCEPLALVMDETTAIGSGDADFPLTLKRIEPEPFRLQLVGLVGPRDAPRGVFENVLSGEMLLIGAQTSIGSLALTVEQVFVERRRAAEASDAPLAPPVATAIVRDERTGTRVTLTTASRSFTSELVAFIASAPSDDETQAVRAGDLIRDGAVVYRIEKIQLAPAAVSVSKWGAGQLAPESRMLSLPPEAGAEQSPGAL